MRALYRKLNCWLDSLSVEGQVSVGAAMSIVLGCGLGALAVALMSPFSVGGYYHPIVKQQWGSIEAVSNCRKSGKSSYLLCDVGVRADDGRLFQSTLRQPVEVGKMVPIAEYKDRGDESGRTFFQFRFYKAD